MINFKGERITLTALGRRHGLNKHCIIDRYNRGDRGEELIRPVKEITVQYEGEEMSLIKLAEVSGISLTAIRQRYSAGIRGSNLTVKNNLNKGIVREDRKLSAEDAKEIFKLAWSGVFKQYEIAEPYNISVSVVSSIKLGKSWFNVTGMVYKPKYKKQLNGNSKNVK